MTDNKILSCLETSIILNGQLFCIWCVQVIDEIKKWDKQDSNFAKVIADLIVIPIETNQRIKAENQLACKTQMR